MSGLSVLPPYQWLWSIHFYFDEEAQKVFFFYLWNNKTVENLIKHHLLHHSSGRWPIKKFLFGFKKKLKTGTCLKTWGPIHNTSFSSELKNGPNKIECYFTQRLKMVARDKHSSLLDPFISCKENELFQMWSLGLCSQHFIFFVT